MATTPLCDEPVCWNSGNVGAEYHAASGARFCLLFEEDSLVDLAGIGVEERGSEGETGGETSCGENGQFNCGEVGNWRVDVNCTE